MPDETTQKLKNDNKEHTNKERKKLKSQNSRPAIENQIDPTILRPAEACRYLGISRTTLHHLHERDPSFPRKIRFSSRCVGLRKESLDAWLEAKEGGI